MNREPGADEPEGECPVAAIIGVAESYAKKAMRCEDPGVAATPQKATRVNRIIKGTVDHSARRRCGSFRKQFL